MGDGVQSARLVARDHTAGALEAAADGDLAGAGGVEPGDGLVRADVPGSLAPQLLQFALAELAAAGSRGGDDADVVRLLGVDVTESGVVEGEDRRAQGEMAEAVGLDEEPLLDEVGGLERPDLARDAQRQMPAALAGDPVEDAEPLLTDFQ